MAIQRYSLVVRFGLLMIQGHERVETSNVLSVVVPLQCIAVAGWGRTFCMISAKKGDSSDLY